MTIPWNIIIYFCCAVLNGINAYLHIKTDDALGAALSGGAFGMWLTLGLVRLLQ